MANANNFQVKNGMTLPKDPVEAMDAATKKYVDAKFSAVTASGIGAAAAGANSDIVSLSGLTTAISVAQGGTGAKTASAARSNLGLGSIATQNSAAISISGGTLNGVVIGETSAAQGYFTNVNASAGITGNLTGDVTGNVTGTASNVTGNVAVANGGTGAASAASARSNLGVVNLTEIGAYGFQLPVGADLDSYLVGGFYRGDQLVNAPNSIDWFYVHVESHDNTAWCKQTATSFGANGGMQPNVTYTRVKQAGTWTAWDRLITSTPIAVESVTSRGTTFPTARVVSNPNVVVTSAASGPGISLNPAYPVGAEVTIVNSTASMLKIYPNTGAAIDSLGYGVALDHGANAKVRLLRTGVYQWNVVAVEGFGGTF